MTITQIKETLANNMNSVIKSDNINNETNTPLKSPKSYALELNTATDKNDNPTDWMRAWDNDSRTAVSIHKELVEEIKADANINSLGLQTETREGSKGKYTAYRVVKFSPAETTL
jgi:hypothetical protein